MIHYFFRFPEQDGSWSPWVLCSRQRYEQALNSEDEDAMETNTNGEGK